jgi:hypothetical protein
MLNDSVDVSVGLNVWPVSVVRRRSFVHPTLYSVPYHGSACAIPEVVVNVLVLLVVLAPVNRKSCAMVVLSFNRVSLVRFGTQTACAPWIARSCRRGLMR